MEIKSLEATVDGCNALNLLMFLPTPRVLLGKLRTPTKIIVLLATTLLFSSHEPTCGQPFAPFYGTVLTLPLSR